MVNEPVGLHTLRVQNSLKYYLHLKLFSLIIGINMVLSEEEKKKIKEEEETKLEEEKYREGVKTKLKKKAWWRPKGFLAWIGIVFVVGWIIYAAALNTNSKPKDTTDLNGNVAYNDFQFKVSNLEQKDWNYCHFTLNSDYHYPGSSFSDKTGPIKAGEVVNIPSSQFAKSDGTRFNPLLVKPQSIDLDCNGRSGYWKW